MIASSPDGIAWTFRPAPADVFYAAGLTSVAWAGGRFVAVGGFGIALSSIDGIDWRADFTGVVAQLQSVATDGMRCAAVGLEGAILVDDARGIDAIFADEFGG